MRALVGMLVALVVLLALAVGADRVVDYNVEKRAAESLAGQLGTTPDVDVAGFPFLTQWGSGRYERVTVTADRATLGDTRVEDVEMVLSDLRAPAYVSNERDVAAATAGSLRMTGTLPYGSLALPAGIKAKRNGTSRRTVHLSGEVEVLGQRPKFEAVVRVSLRDGQVRLEPRSVDFLGGIPSAAITALVRDNLTLTLSPDVPEGTAITGLAVADDGLDLTVTGTNVTMPR
ncbi:MAG: DUF2993 domain-containing protein [Streptosporangiales bacterium]|nr:DUF2993 domain-containing protein [Streptosporangiales bacterium]